MDFNVRDLLLITLPEFFKCRIEIGINWYSISFRTAYDSLRSVIIFRILLGFSIVIELVRIIKMGSIRKYNEVQIARHLFAWSTSRPDTEKAIAYSDLTERKKKLQHGDSL